MGLGISGGSPPEETSGKAEWDNERSSGIQYVRGKLNAMIEYKKLGAGGSVGGFTSIPRPERHPPLMWFYTISGEIKPRIILSYHYSPALTFRPEVGYEFSMV